MKIVLLFTALLVVLIASIGGCSPSGSSIVVSQVSSSTDTATLSKRDSGATSKGSTLVSIRLTSVPDNDTHGLIVLGIDGDKAVEMKWIDPHHLALSCGSCSPQDINFQVVKTGDIAITYDAKLRSE